MIKLNNYITEAWSGVKKHTNNAEIETWCDEMGIEDYTINSQGEIDVDNCVNLMNKQFKELPYKFGKVKGEEGIFAMSDCKNLISLKNCPDEVSRYFDVDGCSQLESLNGCPKKVETKFFCRNCKRKFSKEEVKSLCKVKRNVILRVDN